MNIVKKTKPLVSVIMNCRNGETFLNESLNSILSQTYKNWELIFFDNCSSDKSKAILMKFKKKYKKKIKYFKSKRTLKLYEARNEAIKKTKGTYISFLDTDDFWHKRKLSDQLKFLLKKKADIIFSNYSILNMTSKQKYLRNKRKLPSGNITQNLLDDYVIGILTVLISRKIFLKNQFDNKLEIIGDFDFFLKTSLKYKIFSINKSLATYRYHKKNLSNIKIDLFTRELNYWFKVNKKKFIKYNFTKFKFNLLKLKFKKNLLF